MTDGGDPTTLLILGASGDLAGRLLLPGLGVLLAGGAAGGLELIGSARDDWDDGRWRRRVTDSFAAAGAAGPHVDAVSGTSRYLRADASAEDDLRRLLGFLQRPLVIY